MYSVVRRATRATVSYDILFQLSNENTKKVVYLKPSLGACFLLSFPYLFFLQLSDVFKGI